MTDKELIASINKINKSIIELQLACSRFANSFGEKNRAQISRFSEAAKKFLSLYQLA